MIWKNIVSTRTVAPVSVRWPAMSDLARKTVETVSDFAGIVHNLALDVRDSYRPELHYMRGPGPKWRAKHQALAKRLTPSGSECHAACHRPAGRSQVVRQRCIGRSRRC